MKSSERNWSPDHSTKWSQSMARLRPWFLVHGSKRSRLDEGPSSSSQIVNSRCSEIDPNTTERSPPFPAASAQQRRSIPMELLSRGTDEDSATAVFTRVLPDPDRARQVVHTRLVIHLVRYRGSRTGRRGLATIRLRDRTRRGVGVFSAERDRKCARPPRTGGRTGSVVPARPDRRSASSRASAAVKE